MAVTSPLPFLTPESCRIEGVMKSVASDFQVEEIPAYRPCGSGEHLFLWIEKENTSAEQLVAHLARGLQVSRNDIGVAGLKDRLAITRQWVSVPARHSGDVVALSTANIRVLEQCLHQNKLKTGHLKGNHFRIVLRDVPQDAAAALPLLLEAVGRQGVPNYFGDQRFGRDGETLRLGLDLLSGAKSPGAIPFARRKFLLRLALSAVQSMLFNDVLAERIRQGTLQRVAVGDIMEVCASGGLFEAIDVVSEESRVLERETVPTGPLFGPKMKSPQGSSAELEAQVLAQHGLTRADFEKFAKLTSGARRPLLLYPQDLQGEVNARENSLHLQFTLPPGCYATVLLREFLKPTETVVANDA